MSMVLPWVLHVLGRFPVTPGVDGALHHKLKSVAPPLRAGDRTLMRQRLLTPFLSRVLRMCA